jgi:hypothetical protein
VCPPKVNNSIKKDLKNSEMDENKLKRIMKRMINEIEEDVYMCINT